jgi:hypothetical protein
MVEAENFSVYSACKVEKRLLKLLYLLFLWLWAHPPPFNGYQGLKGLGEKLNAYLYRIPRLRMSGVVFLLLHIPSWRAQGEL